MRMYVFGVYDDKAKAFLPPFFLPEKAMALRTFGDCVNDSSHQWGRHPADYTLFVFGEFDQSTGKFSIEPAFELLANGVMVKAGVGSMANGAAMPRVERIDEEIRP